MGYFVKEFSVHRRILNVPVVNLRASDIRELSVISVVLKSQDLRFGERGWGT
jgi:hypothetical protein